MLSFSRILFRFSVFPHISQFPCKKTTAVEKNKTNSNSSTYSLRLVLLIVIMLDILYVPPSYIYNQQKRQTHSYLPTRRHHNHSSVLAVRSYSPALGAGNPPQTSCFHTHFAVDTHAAVPNYSSFPARRFQSGLVVAENLVEESGECHEKHNGSLRT